METHARYFLIGAFSLSILALLLLFALWLGKLELNKDRSEEHTSELQSPRLSTTNRF